MSSMTSSASSASYAGSRDHDHDHEALRRPSSEGNARRIKTLDEWLAENENSSDDGGKAGRSKQSLTNDGTGKGRSKKKKRKKGSGGQVKEDTKKSIEAERVLGILKNWNGLRDTKEEGEIDKDEIAEAKKKVDADEVEDGINWIGLLYEFRSTHPLHHLPETALGLSAVDIPPIPSRDMHFTCQISIPEHGFDVPPFTGRAIRKKDAQRKAAKSAIQWLEEHGYAAWVSKRIIRESKSGKNAWNNESGNASSNGSTTDITADAEVKASTTTASLVNTPTAIDQEPTIKVEEGSGLSFPRTMNANGPIQRAKVLASRLGWNEPQYFIEPRVGFPSLYNGYAIFQHTREKVGYVRGVYGRKNARVAVADGVVDYLEWWIAKRNGENEKVVEEKEQQQQQEIEKEIKKEEENEQGHT